MLNKRGFTIIELLVVIIVIAIIAAITIVSYNSVTAKSRNSKTGVAVKMYIEALNLYKAYNGRYPTGNANGQTCLGTGYPGGKCWLGSTDENSTFMNALKDIYGDKFVSTANQSLGAKGAWFNTAGATSGYTLDGVYENFVVYSAEGPSSRCPVGPIASNAGDTDLSTYSATQPSSGRTKISADNTYVECWIPLSLVE